jgi:SAM-dependent methyltransferase
MKLANPPLAALDAALSDLQSKPARLRTPEGGSGDTAACEVESSRLVESAPRLLEFAGDDALLVFVRGSLAPDDAARLREALWPRLHVSAHYLMSQQGVSRRELGGSRDLRKACGLSGTLVVCGQRSKVLSPETTVAKFDANAKGWDGDPSRPGWAHHRWMRWFVGVYADASRARRVLDFGSGAGWCGIEASLVALRAGGKPHLALFDPSPEMVRRALENARAAGLDDVEGRVGFGAEPPFPAAGEEPYDHVVSSGVVSFAPDAERFADGLARVVAPGGTLVFGDVSSASRGVKKRRAREALVAVREMNALDLAGARRLMEARGFRCVRGSHYQLSDPWPQLAHHGERRLGAWFGRAILARNRAAAEADKRAPGDPARFDSWVAHFVKET